jgi:hypothetical protein
VCNLATQADLARMAENKVAIMTAGAVPPLVAMLSAESPLAQRHACGALWQLASIGKNKEAIANAHGIAPLVTLLTTGAQETQKFATGALYALLLKSRGATPPTCTSQKCRVRLTAWW